ncbi:hypothetical protein RclHR1_25080001 [Rhizophagus clarus]|uniref:Uncharacterized protein n=1 Tax=Rhizophagus clarus TaxID=94130 RepID=A0A2Z6REF7_9GLOM|nr:hypothetical protein RclHR1_25080001 [Rhizophagus clarus]
MATRRYKDKGEETSKNKHMKMSENSIKVKDDPVTYMSLIIEKLRNENKNLSKILIAYTISICETFLNPENQDIHINEKLLKLKIIKNLQKLKNKKKFLCSVAEDEFLSTDADNSKLGKDANDDKGINNIDGKNADNGKGVDTDRNGEGVNTNSKGNKGTSIKNNKGKGIYDSDRLYNTEEEDQYLSSLFDNYELRRR